MVPQIVLANRTRFSTSSIHGLGSVSLFISTYTAVVIKWYMNTIWCPSRLLPCSCIFSFNFKTQQYALILTYLVRAYDIRGRQKCCQHKPWILIFLFANFYQILWVFLQQQETTSRIPITWCLQWRQTSKCWPYVVSGFFFWKRIDLETRFEP